MGVLKNDVGRPSNKTIMIRTILRLIVVLLVVGLVGFLAYNYGKKEKGEKVPVVKEEVKTEKITKEEAHKIVNEVFESEGNLFSLSDENHLKSLAIKKSKEKHINAKCSNLFDESERRTDMEYSYPDAYITQAGLCGDGDQTYYSYEEANNIYKKMYGKDKKLEKKSFADEVYMAGYAYSPKLDAFVSTSLEGGDGPDLIKYNITGEKNSNNVIITVKYSVGEYVSEPSLVETDDLNGLDNILKLEFKKEEDHYIFVKQLKD